MYFSAEVFLPSRSAFVLQFRSEFVEVLPTTRARDIRIPKLSDCVYHVKQPVELSSPNFLADGCESSVLPVPE